MKASVTLFLLFAFLSIAGGSEDVASKVTVLFKPFHHAIREALDPWNDDQDRKELMPAIAKLADEHVLPLIGELHQSAIAELKQLEIREFDLSKYEIRFRSDFDLTTIPLDPSEGSSPGMLVHGFWSAKQAAQQYRISALSRHMKVQEYGTLALRDRLAPPELFAVSAEPERPVVVIGSGDELCIVEMQYVETGYYKMTSVLFVTKK